MKDHSEIFAMAFSELAIFDKNELTPDLTFSEHFITRLQVNDSKLYPSTAFIKSECR